MTSASSPTGKVRAEGVGRVVCARLSKVRHELLDDAWVDEGTIGGQPEHGVSGIAP